MFRHAEEARSRGIRSLSQVLSGAANLPGMVALKPPALSSVYYVTCSQRIGLSIQFRAVLPVATMAIGKRGDEKPLTALRILYVKTKTSGFS